MSLTRMQADTSRPTLRRAIPELMARAGDMTYILPDVVRCLHSVVAPCFVRDYHARTAFTNDGFRQLNQMLASSDRSQTQPRVIQVLFERADQLLQSRMPSSWLLVRIQDTRQIRVLLSAIQNDVGDRVAVLGVITDPDVAASTMIEGQPPHPKPAAHADDDPAMRGFPDAAYARWASMRREACERVKRLSEREKQVASLVAVGVANKVVAHKLDVSVKTIEKHRANAMRKMSVANSAELVRVLLLAELDGTVNGDHTAFVQ